MCHAAGMCLQPTTWGGVPFRLSCEAQQLCRNVCIAQYVMNSVCILPAGKCLIFIDNLICKSRGKMDLRNGPLAAKKKYNKISVKLSLAASHHPAKAMHHFSF